MPAAYKRLNSEDCVFLFVDHQASTGQPWKSFQPTNSMESTSPA